MPVVIPETDEQYHEWIRSSKEGFVLNTYKNPASDYMVLHTSHCHAINKPPLSARDNNPFTRGNYIKVCSTSIQEIIDWLKSDDLKISNFCGHCHPDKTLGAEGQMAVLALLRKKSNSESLEVLEDQHQREIEQRTDIGDTEKQRLVNTRRGQGIFKRNVRRIHTQCLVTGVDVPELLIASHIKPWVKSSDFEKLDGNNGLLLAPHIDKLFDKGFISFEDNGKIMVSSQDIQDVMTAWGVDVTRCSFDFNLEQCKYLEHHRTVEFYSLDKQ